jgi:uridine kinase
LNNDLEKNLKNNKKIIKKLFINDTHDDSFRNSLNYCKKVYNGLQILENNFDLYIIIRTDLILTSINVANIEDNILYFSHKNMNQFTKNITDKVNDNIILTKDYNLLLELRNLYDFTINNNNYLDIVLYNYLNNKHINYSLIDIEYKLILSNCNIIAIAGDSGSGKSTLLKVLTPLFDNNNNNILTLETDRYHKWERGNENYQKYTHLNPYANHLEKMYEDVYDLKIGNEIYQVDYDHNTGKFTQKEKIESKNNIIICGLHTMHENKIKNILDIKIFMDTDRELIKKWKIQRDVNERGYSMEKVLKQIEDREKDYEQYISTQKVNADIIINFYEFENKLECNLIIQNINIINKILKELLRLNYEINYENNNLIVKLKNYIEFYFNTEILDNNIFKNNYYKEIFYIISLFV